MSSYYKIVTILIAIFCWSCSDRIETAKPAKILVFSATKGFRHNSIEQGKTALMNLGITEHWVVDTTENSNQFTAANLNQYSVVIFLNTTGDILNEEQQISFQKFIRAGGSFVGIHSAADTESEWLWYNGLVGAIFESHPTPQSAKYVVINKNHPSVTSLPDTFRREEEIYNFKSFKGDSVNVLITVDEKSYNGGTMPGYHPISWYHTVDGGKAFYTAWGHSPDAFTEAIFLQHITGAIKWALTK